MKRLICVLLTLSLFVCCFNPFTPASAAQIDENASTYEWMRLTYTTIVPYGNGYKVQVSIPYIVSSNLSNASSFEIDSIGSGTVTKVAGWSSVQSSLRINSITYYDNYQKAVLDVTYSASIGAGYDEYNATITMTVPNYT